MADAMLRALHPGSSGVDPGLELHGVEVAPDALLLVVIDGELRAAFRARPEHTVPMLQKDVHPLTGNVQFDPSHMPGRLQSEESSVKIRVLHAVHRRAGASPTSSGYPPESRKNLFLCRL